ncbi:hypothetical protein [Paenibacillus etheri]|uniref:Uncharacterized protein n=1 Tax=Paenibacillus etheri TaxID=1306852 RepID=A0A0W1AWW8_9BACL|nr:hypothetical protein [Paenibacillus etheri]KTD85741.1 hypothetical protein UQ64_19855 [Paenibacillus etheri]
MRSKRNLIMLLLFALTIILSACNHNKPAVLSMNELRDLAQRGEELTWEDFDAYPFEDVGSGLYIRKYEINDDYHVLVGGGSVDAAPLYINLVKRNGEKIDIRYDDIDHFILN